MFLTLKLPKRCRRPLQQRATQTLQPLFHLRHFSAQQKVKKKKIKQKPSISEQKEEESTTKPSEEDINNLFEDDLITLTPRQKIREWTKIHHKIDSTKWIKNHLGIYTLFVNFFCLNIANKGLPFWALHIKYIQSRYLQRMWATRILRRESLGEIWSFKSLLNPTKIRIDPNKLTENNQNDICDEDDLNYLCYAKPPGAYITNSDSKKDEDLLNSEDEKTIVHSLQFWFDTYSARNYWHAFDHEQGNIIFSNVKWKEHKFRKDAQLNAIRDEETNLLKPKDQNKKLNPYKMIPEENVRTENIQYGGRYLSDFVDYKPQRKYLQNYSNYNSEKLLTDNAKTENQNVDDDYKESDGYKVNRSLSFFRGIVSGKSIKENVSDIESIEFGDKDDFAEVTKVIGKREVIDMRNDMKMNKKFSGWHQFKQMLPTSEEIGIILKLKKLAFVKAVKMVMDDYNYVFKRGGGEILRNGYPPQMSLMEFTALDQYEAGLGSFGANHSMFSDWFVAIDNKREECDKSYGDATIVNDRLIFEGFLFHSCIEMGHRSRNRWRDYVGFVNLCSHEFEPEIDLGHYYSIGIKLRSDGRPYLLGLECLNRNKFMIFNGIISVAATPDDEWDYYEIPLHHFRPYDNGEFIEGQNFMQVRYLRSIGIQAIGATGSFNLEIAWIRAMSFEARFDIEDEEVSFIQDIDAMGIYKEDLMKFHIIQHQYFIDDFPDPFRFEDNGVFDDNVYLGPPRSQREHFGKMAPDLLRYIDVIDDVPLSIDAQKYLHYYLDSDDMYMFENYLSDKLIGQTKAIQQLFKPDAISISDATNNLLYNQLKNQSKHNQYLTSGVYHNENIHRVARPETVNKAPFGFKDMKQTSNNPITILTQRRRELLRFSVPEHLRERVVGKWPHLM